MRTFMTTIVAIWLIGAAPLMAHANTMYGTGTVTSLDKNSIVISGTPYALHKNVHVGVYRQSGTSVVEETRSLSAVEPGQEVRYKIIGTMVLELIILKR